MPSVIQTRPFSEEERATVEKWLAESPTGWRRTKEFLQNALVLWAATMLAGVALLAALKWLAVRAGWEYAHMLLGLASLTTLGLLTLGYAVWSSTKWIKKWKDMRPLLRSALKDGRAQAEAFLLVEAKRYQEPEHGGLIYLARTDDDRIVCLYDRESQDLGVQDEDPLNSSFRVKNSLEIVRVPFVNWPLSILMNGKDLDVGDPRPLNLPPHDWPEADAVVDFAWDTADALMSSKRRIRSG